MIGLSVALLIVLFQMYISKKRLIEAFPTATKFLFWWYVATASTLGVLAAILTGASVAGIGVLMSISPFGRNADMSDFPIFILLISLLTLIPFLLQMLGAKLLQYAVKIHPDGSRTWRYLFLFGFIPIGISVYIWIQVMPFAS